MVDYVWHVPPHLWIILCFLNVTQFVRLESQMKDTKLRGDSESAEAAVTWIPANADMQAGLNDNTELSDFLQNKSAINIYENITTSPAVKSITDEITPDRSVMSQDAGRLAFGEDHKKHTAINDSSKNDLMARTSQSDDPEPGTSSQHKDVKLDHPQYKSMGGTGLESQAHITPNKSFNIGNHRDGRINDSSHVYAVSNTIGNNVTEKYQGDVNTKYRQTDIIEGILSSSLPDDIKDGIPLRTSRRDSGTELSQNAMAHIKDSSNSAASQDQNYTLDFRTSVDSLLPLPSIYTASKSPSIFTVAKALPPNANLKTLYIGGLFELSDTSFTVTGLSELAAATLAIQHINEQKFIPGYQLDMVYNDTKVSTIQHRGNCFNIYIASCQ